MERKVIVQGRLFKRLVAAVTKFPTLGSFGGSEMVNLSCAEGYLTATAMGVVLSVARVKAEGAMDLVAVNERELVNFASVVRDSRKVTISRQDNQVELRRGKPFMTVNLMPGTQLARPKLKDIVPVKVSSAAAERLRYLSAIAYNDTSRAELCCVMLKGKLAIALDQKAVCVLSVPLRTDGPVPLPLPLARAVEAGTKLYMGSNVTALRIGCAVYSMPALAKAQTDFPFGTITLLEKSLSKREVAVIDGSRLANALEECVKCLGNLARTEAMCKLFVHDGYVDLTGSNGGAKFSHPGIPLIKAISGAEFRVPLESLNRARPFMTGELMLARNKYSDLFLKMMDGWAMFPSEEKQKKHA